MEEKKKVYIRGRKGRGQEAIDFLTGLGATATDLRCDSDALIYFINHDNEIDCTNVCTEKALIIMDNYKEIELPQQWEDGDILIHNNYPHCYAVFKKRKDYDTFEAYFVLDNKNAYFDATVSSGHYRLANAKEIEGLPLLFTFLMGALNKAGFCLPKNVAQNPLPDNKINRLEDGDD